MSYKAEKEWADRHRTLTGLIIMVGSPFMGVLVLSIPLFLFGLFMTIRSFFPLTVRGRNWAIFTYVLLLTVALLVAIDQLAAHGAFEGLP